MSRWDARLDRLADRIGGGACPECGAGGQGPRRITVQQPGDPDPQPCGTCGAEPYRFTLTLDNPNNIDMGETP